MRRPGPAPTPEPESPHSAAPSPASARRRRWWPYLVLAVGLLLALRALVVQSFSIPSGSMEPTIEPGDRILVSRLARGDALHRGDIVVFDGTTAFPVGATGTDYVKRVIGLPGDRVSCCDPAGRLRVNQVALDEPYLAPGDTPSTLTFDAIVPAGHLWVMGDHRSESEDSRSFLGRPGGGMVPVDAVIGQATVRYWPLARLGSLGGPGPAATVPSPAGAAP